MDFGPNYRPNPIKSEPDGVRHRQRMYYHTCPQRRMMIKQLNPLVNDRLALYNALIEKVYKGETSTSASFLLRVQAKLQQAGPGSKPDFFSTILRSIGAKLNQARQLDQLSHFLCRAFFCRTDKLKDWFCWFEYKLLRHRLLFMLQTDSPKQAENWCGCDFEQFTMRYSQLTYWLMHDQAWAQYYPDVQPDYKQELIGSSNRIYKVEYKDYEDLIGAPDPRMCSGQNNHRVVFIKDTILVDMICLRFRKDLDQELLKLAVGIPKLTANPEKWPHIKDQPIAFSDFLTGVRVALNELLCFFQPSNGHPLRKVSAIPVATTSTSSTNIQTNLNPNQHKLEPQPTQQQSNQLALGSADNNGMDPVIDWEGLDLSFLDNLPNISSPNHVETVSTNQPIPTQPTQSTVKSEPVASAEEWEDWDPQFQQELENKVRSDSALDRLPEPLSSPNRTFVRLRSSQASRVSVKTERLPNGEEPQPIPPSDHVAPLSSPPPEIIDSDTPNDQDETDNSITTSLITKEIKVVLVRLTPEEIAYHTNPKKSPTKRKSTASSPQAGPSHEHKRTKDYKQARIEEEVRRKQRSPRRKTPTKPKSRQTARPRSVSESDEINEIPETDLDETETELEEKIPDEDRKWLTKKDPTWKPKKDDRETASSSFSNEESEEMSESEEESDIERPGTSRSIRTKRTGSGRKTKRRKRLISENRELINNTARSKRRNKNNEETDIESEPETRTKRKSARVIKFINDSDSEVEENPKKKSPAKRKQPTPAKIPTTRRSTVELNSDSESEEEIQLRRKSLRSKKGPSQPLESDFSGSEEIVNLVDDDDDATDDDDGGYDSEESRYSDEDSPTRIISIGSAKKRRYQCKARTPKEPTTASDFLL